MTGDDGRPPASANSPLSLVVGGDDRRQEVAAVATFGHNGRALTTYVRPHQLAIASQQRAVTSICCNDMQRPGCRRWFLADPLSPVAPRDDAAWGGAGHDGRGRQPLPVRPPPQGLRGWLSQDIATDERHREGESWPTAMNEVVGWPREFSAPCGRQWGALS